MDAVIDVDVAGVLFDETTDTAVVLLGGAAVGDRVVPIAIGPAEAQSIAIGLSNLDVPRPLAHDLLLTVVAAASGRVRRVDVVGMRHDTFLAELEIESAAGVVRIDARPSDCIALAVRSGIPIGVERRLFDRASVAVLQGAGTELEQEQIDRIVAEFQAFLEHAEPEDFIDAGEPDDLDEGGPGS